MMSKIYEKDFNQTVLRRLQLTQVEILDEIVRICEKFNLSYYLVGGTLLGAIRHKGFIPWDDDLDIAMPRKDYIQFCKLCQTELEAKYFLHFIGTDKKYWLSYAKVRKLGTVLNERNIAQLNVEKGIFVDVFPLDDAMCENSLKGLIRTKVIKLLSFVICYKRGLRFALTFKQRLLLVVGFPFSIGFLTKIQLKLMQLSNGKNNPYYINYGSNYNTVKQTIPKDKYEPYRLGEFENKQYRIPSDYDYVLRRIYNEYMELPPEEQRVLRHKPEYIDFGE